MTGLPLSAKLLHHAQHAPDAPALVDGAAIVSHAELRERAMGCAAWLAAEGCRAGETVGVTVAGEYANAVVSVALLHLGVPQVSLVSTDPPALRAELAQRLAVRRIIADVPGAGLHDIPVSRLAPKAIEAFGAEACSPLSGDPDAPALYAASSGTTGRPKLLALSQQLLACRSAFYGVMQDFAPGERIVVPMPQESYPGKTMLLYALYHGMSVVLDDGASAGSAIVESALRTGASILQLTVLQARGLVTDSGGAPRLPRTTRVFIGAARMPEGLPHAFETRVGGRLFNRYGTSEVGAFSNTYPVGEDGVPDSVGRIVPGAEVEVIDADGRILPPGHVGELRLRTPWMVPRYHDDERATALHFRAGWFYPRDVGLVTPDGILRFLGRVDDMMSLNGINIFPAEIERVLEEHPAVKHAAAFPIPSAVHGDIPAAAVEPIDGADLDRRELERYARDRLGARAPRRIVVLAALPRNANGKILKRELAASLGRLREAP
jgi:acyl-CoA synthetase (AMP-forming)/AMP-acid ligase II